METALSAKPDGSWDLGNNSGTTEENTGQRMASPMPLKKVNTSKVGAVKCPQKTRALKIEATTATQICVKIKNRLRSKISAKAPHGKPSKKTGKVEADCTKATHTGVTFMDVIIQAPATSFIHMQILAMSQHDQSMRKMGSWKGRSRFCSSCGVEFKIGSLGSWVMFGSTKKACAGSQRKKQPSRPLYKIAA